MNASFAPLIQLILDKKVKYPKDVGSLNFKPPMGIRPDDVEEDVARKFVKEFVPSIWAQIKAEKLKRTMTNLRKKLRGLSKTQDSAPTSATKPTPLASPARISVAIDPSFQPLIALILAKKVRRPKDMDALALNAPMGMKPSDVSSDVARKFVKEFAPSLWKEIKAGGGKKTMTSFRKKIASLMEGGGGGGTGSDSKVGGVDNAKAPSKKKKKEEEAKEDGDSVESQVERMIEKGMGASAILKKLGVPFDRRDALKTVYDSFVSQRSLGLTTDDMYHILDSFDITTVKEDELLHLMGIMTGPKEMNLPEGISFLRFALFVNGMFGDIDKGLSCAFHLFANETQNAHAKGKKESAHELSPEEVVAGMQHLDARSFTSEEAKRILTKGTKLKDFIAALREDLDDSPRLLASVRE